MSYATFAPDVRRVENGFDVGWGGTTGLTVQVDETFLVRGTDLRSIEATISPV